MGETEREELKEAYRKEKDPTVVARMLAVHMVYSDTPKFVPGKLHQAENFVDRFVL